MFHALNLPADPSGLLAERAVEVDAAYRELAARLGEDTPASIDADGKLHVAALDAKAEPASLVDLRRRVEAMIPRVDLPELVMEVMSWHQGFVESFTHVSGEPARVADLGLSVAAGPAGVRGGLTERLHRAEIEQCGVLERDGALPVTVVGIYKLDAAGKLARIHGDMDMAIFIAFGLRRHASMMLDKKSKSRATRHKSLSIR